MYRLYVNGVFHKSYKTHGAAQSAFAKMYHLRGTAKFRIEYVA